MAVRIDIRPRLTLRDEQPAKTRRRFRLPPLTVPAVGYWLAMGALTYFFAHIGPNPLESALAAPELAPPAPLPLPAAPVTPAPEPEPVAAATAEPPLLGAEAATSQEERADDTVAEPPPEPLLANREEQDREERARRREEVTREHDAVARREEPAPRLSFPEFTDSSRPAARERAADGPRIDSLFERREDRPGPGASPTPAAPPEAERDAPAVASSCEGAIARNNEQLEIGGPRRPADITREAYASILQNGSYLTGCSLPDRTVFEICAAVRDGRAVGVTVTSSPPSPSLNACVRRAVSRLKFPSSPKLDVTHTRFDAARR